MNCFRAILPLVFLAAVCVPGFAWAADESVSPQPVPQLEAENTAQADGDDPWLARTDARFEEGKRETRKLFYLLLAAMIAFLGLPRLAWKNGKLEDELEEQ